MSYLVLGLHLDQWGIIDEVHLVINFRLKAPFVSLIYI